ncbi:MAG: OmpA family protein [Bacteroidales bacterium]|nr:OmpA family protein [Bacteroidales bacterium]
MKTVRIISMLTLAMALTGAMPAQAQQKQTDFAPQWYVLPQVGLGYHVGEASFGDLLSPAFQLGVGYRFTPLFGLRASMSGFQARNWQCHPVEEYKWNYMQGNIDAALSVTDLIWGWDTDRRWNAHALAGIGLNLSFKNDDANALAATPTAPGEPNAGFEELWSGKKAFFAMRLGADVEYSLNERFAIGLEYSANALPDKWNSKRGKDGNMDWQQNLLAGVRVNIGQNRKPVQKPAPRVEVDDEPIVITPPIVEEPKPVVVEEPKPVVVEEPKPEVVEAPAPEPKPIVVPDLPDTKVYYTSGSMVISEADAAKLRTVAEYLKQYPEKQIVVNGYASPDGSMSFNQRLSEKRANAVKQWLVDNGVDASRIEAVGKGPKDLGGKKESTCAIITMKK